MLNLQDQELREKVSEIILFFLNERRKGNDILKIYNYYGPDTHAEIQIIYIWYKYFSGLDFKKISPLEVIQSCRYGVRGDEDMEQLKLEGKEKD